VRGFEERAVRGDSGVATNIEFWSRRQFGHDLRFGGFLDWGYVRREAPAAGVLGSATVASIGAGARYRLDSRLTARVELAHVLRGTEDRPRGSNRVFAGVVLAF
jgi:hemolysin activation/secretion protein